MSPATPHFDHHDGVAAICGPRRFKLIPTRANGQPAFGCYLCDDTAPIARAHGLIVLTLAGDHIAEITRFLDNSLLPPFGLPRVLPRRPSPSDETAVRGQISSRRCPRRVRAYVPRAQDPEMAGQDCTAILDRILRSITPDA